MDGGVPADRFRAKEQFFDGGSRKRHRRSTFQVNTVVVKRQAQACARTNKSGTSSNVVISRDQISPT